MKAKNPECPCGSGKKYSDCCRPFHRGEEPKDAPTLMRSRFSAFALGETEYLWRTLHPEHPDRVRGRDALVAELRSGRQVLRYVRLRVLDHDEAPGGETARVLFHVEMYARGKECSFAELSTFLRTEEGWRYRSGVGRTMPASSPELEGLRIGNAEALLKEPQ